MALWPVPWWTYQPARLTLFDAVYHWFNLFEGSVWIVFSVLVLRRWQQGRRSWLEVVDSALFLVFGPTDFREANVKSVPPVLAKGVVLVLLLWARSRVLKAFYHGAWW